MTANNGAGPRYMVSAAHCSPGLATGGTAYTGPSATLNNAGTVQFITSEFPARDILLIGGASYANSIYTGTGFTGSNQFFSAGDPGLNFVYCNGGVVTRAACNIRVRSTSFLFCDASGCTPDLVYLSRDDRSNVVCRGDSGGPLYYISGSNALIRGMVVGGAGGGPQCFPELYTHKWSTIQQRYTLAAP